MLPANDRDLYTMMRSAAALRSKGNALAAARLDEAIVRLWGIRADAVLRSRGRTTPAPDGADVVVDGGPAGPGQSCPS